LVGGSFAASERARSLRVTSFRVDPMPPSSTTRVTYVMDALVRAPERSVGVRELAAQLLMSRSATHRILATLSDLGLARTLEGGRYAATSRAHAWAHFMSIRNPVLVQAPAIMARLSEQASESVHLLARTAQPSVGVFILSAEGPHPVQHRALLGQPSPLTAGAGGKAILSAVPEAVLAEVMRSLAATDPHRAPVLKDELARIRRDGYATSVSELMPETAGVAAPFRRYDNVFGSLTVSMPAYRYTPAHAEKHAPLVRAAAEELSRVLSVAVTDAQRGPGRDADGS
jgi:DNA-binding IclR family transcriptional regulator